MSEHILEGPGLMFLGLHMGSGSVSSGTPVATPTLFDRRPDPEKPVPFDPTSEFEQGSPIHPWPEVPNPWLGSDTKGYGDFCRVRS
jgi:hypothetical protein